MPGHLRFIFHFPTSGAQRYRILSTIDKAIEDGIIQGVHVAPFLTQAICVTHFSIRYRNPCRRLRTCPTDPKRDSLGCEANASFELIGVPSMSITRGRTTCRFQNEPRGSLFARSPPALPSEAGSNSQPRSSRTESALSIPLKRAPTPRLMDFQAPRWTGCGSWITGPF